MIMSMILCAISQPLLATNLGSVWRVGLVSSGVLEMGAFATVLSLLILTALRGPRPTTRPAYWSVFPFIAGAFCTFDLASIINLVNCARRQECR
jgi:tellurite resistance protein TehA-like permease